MVGSMTSGLVSWPGPVVLAGAGRGMREAMMTSAVRGSWRTMSRVTKWECFLLRMTRASRA